MVQHFHSQRYQNDRLSQSIARRIKRRLRRFNARPIVAGLLLVSLLLSTQPWVVWASGADTVKETTRSITSSLDTSGLTEGVTKWFKNLKSSKPTARPVAQRSARRLHVKGNKLKMSVGTRQQVTAIAVDGNEDAIDGIKFDWSSTNPAVAEVDETGIVKANSVGHADIVANGGGLQEFFRVQVLQQVEEEKAPDPYYLIPSAGQGANLGRDSGTGYKYRTAAYRKGVINAAATAAPYQMSILDPSPNVQTSPSTNVGTPPFAPISGGGGSSVDPASSSYNRVFPMVSLSGRGEAGINLSLVYNSQLWTYDASNSTAPYQYNVNRDWPGPGFHLDFGKVNYQAGTGGNPDQYMYVGSDGTRHPMQNTTTNEWETTDGTFIHIVRTGSGSPVVYTYTAYFPNGMVITYSQGGPDGYYYATRIQDRNGNYVTVTYTSSTTAQIDHVTDTLGRSIQFFYTSPDSNGNTWLSYITAPDQGGTRRTVANFYYDSSATVLSGSFSNGAAKVNGIDVPTCSSSCGITYLHRIYYPATGTGYVLTTSGAYGQITSIKFRQGMTTASEGTDSNNVAYTTFNYPTSGPLSATPKFDTRAEWWVGADSTVSVPVSYTYSSSNDGTYNIYTTTDPTGRKQVMKTPLSGTFNGITEIDEVQNSSGTALSRVTYSYNIDSSSDSPQVSTVTSTDVPASLSRQVSYHYPSSGATYNNPTEIDEYGFSSELLRKTVLTYVTDTNYTSVTTGKPRLLNLLASSTLYQGTSSTALARTEYSYDTYTGGGIDPQDRTEGGTNVTQHDRTDFSNSFYYRGNRTRVTEYPNYASSSSIYMQHQTKYDILGNIVSEDLSCCQQKTFTYDVAQKFAWPITVTSGTSPTISDSYTYEFATGNILSHTNPNTTTTRTTTYSYNAGDLRLNSTALPTGAHTDIAYDDVNLKVTQTTYQASGTSSSDKKAQVETDYDGLGNVLTAKKWSGSTNFDEVDNIYDSVGRLVKQTNPFPTGSAPSPHLYTQIAYDERDRTTTITLPDSQTVQYAYDGRFSKVTDQVGRKKISAVDALGRLAQVIEVASNTADYPTYASITTTSGWGSVYGYNTTYSYDALDNLTTINQGSQTRSFVYDGMSRLLYESLPEQVSNISYNSQNYSKKYEYDSLSSQHINGNLRRVTDSRGDVKTLFYDGLNRPIACKYSGTNTATDFYYYWDGSTSVTVGTDDFNSTSFTKTTSRPTGFTSSNSTGQLSAVVDDGSHKGDYFEYGSDGQVLKHLERVYDGTTSTDFLTQTAYNNLLLPTSLTYPSTRQIDYTYDSAMRPFAITDHNNSSLHYVNNVAYNSADQPTAFDLGDTTNETFSYNNRLQLSGQTTKKSGTTLLDFSYSYAGSAGNHGAGTTAGNSGQLIQMQDNFDSSKSVSYTYDLLGRLKTAQAGTSGWSVSETYDRYGNRWLQDRIGNSPTGGTSGSTTITVSGSEQSTFNTYADYCLLYDDSGGCLEWHYTTDTIYDAGTVSVKVGSYTASSTYGSSSTPSSIASSLASTFNGDSSSPVTASASSANLTLTAKATGLSGNYSISTSAATYDPGDFGGPSFGASGSNMSGGSPGIPGSGGTGPQSSLTFDSNNHINSVMIMLGI